jgi:PAS domain S-box-containing protein
MVHIRHEVEAAVARALAEPGLAGVLAPGASAAAWDGGGRLVWATPDIEAAVERPSALPPATADRIKALAAGLAPTQGFRLERLRFDPGGLAPPSTCVSRLLHTAGGEPILLTAFLGPPPTLPRPPDRRATPPTPESPPASIAVPEAPGRERGTVRFVWQADAEGRFTEVSPALADVVGADAADIVGRTWHEIQGRLVDDPAHEVETLFARAETWSSRTVFWRVEGSDVAVAVDLAGLPLLGRNRQLLGFRGFGLCRTDALSAWSELRGTPEDGPPAPPPKPRPESVAAAPAVPSAQSIARLSTQERNAFREIARALGGSFRADEGPDAPPRPAAPVVPLRPPARPDPNGARILDRVPFGILVHRGETPLFANRSLLDALGYRDVAQLAADGGVARLFGGAEATRGDGPRAVLLTSRTGAQVPADVRLGPAEWDGVPAALMVVRTLGDADPGQRLQALQLELQASNARVRELAAMLDTASDGVVVLDEVGRIRSLNRSAEALFGYVAREVVGEPFIILFATDSHPVALEYFDFVRASPAASLLNDGREVIGRVRQGGAVPLFMTVGHVGESPERTFCAVLRDVTGFKKAERELVAARRAAEAASAHKSDFLAKVSHEIRTPLSAIIGFAEVMLEERFGPVANERYTDYLKDIHGSGRHVISLVNDLLDLAKIEAGRMDLAFTSVALNDVVSTSVGLLQPQAARDRIIVRTSFAPQLPPIVADERSVRQIVLNLVSNAIKFTEPGGQVIVSTAVTDRGEVAFRVRDTGIGMSEQELKGALEPFRQVSTSRKGGGTGLGLPLTKALVDANRGALHITSARDAGTLAEVLLPARAAAAE